VAAAGLSERAGRPIGFVTFLRVGLPVTMISMLLASGYLLIRYVLLT
jgi:Na+/H+ antiporter NhaD/arsenite permease-like protein